VKVARVLESSGRAAGRSFDAVAEAVWWSQDGPPRALRLSGRAASNTNSCSWLETGCADGVYIFLNYGEKKMTKIINVASLMTSREKNLRRRLATVNCKRKTPQLKFS
jgi:hypothetical protein